MDPNLLNIIGSAAAGLLAGGALWNLFLERRKKRARLLSRGTMRRLGLDPDDNVIETIFTHKTERRVALAEQVYEETQEMVKATKSDVDRSSENLADSRKELERLRKNIEACASEGDQIIIISTDLTAKLKEIAQESMVFSTNLDLYLRQFKTSSFWNIVRRGVGRQECIDAMTKRSSSTAEQDTKLQEALESAQRTLKMSDSNVEKVMNLYIKRLN